MPCGANFITGDVVKWVYPVWERRGRKWVKVGEHAITAQAVDVGEEWATLVVKKTADPELKVGEIIRRRREKIGEGNAQRLEWRDVARADDSIRAEVVAAPVEASRFLKPKAMKPAATAGRPARRVKARQYGGKRRKGGKRPPTLTP
jgi:hypothetical protein